MEEVMKMGELTELKRRRLIVLEGELEKAKQALQVKIRELTEMGIFNPDKMYNIWEWSNKNHILYKIKILKCDMERTIADKIIGPDIKEHTKEEFQQNIRNYVFHTFPQGREVIRLTGWTIPSFDGIELPQLFKDGVGVIQIPKIIDEFQCFRNYYPSLTYCNIELSRCRIRTLGSVVFPPFAYTINLRDNDITHLNNVHFGKCVQINLSGNFIISLRGCYFSDGLTCIDLQDNFISRIEDLNIEALPQSLESILLDGNPIVEKLSYEQYREFIQQILKRIQNPVQHSLEPSGQNIEDEPCEKTKNVRKYVNKLKKNNRKTNKHRRYIIRFQK